ncbi:MAG TPA: NAD(P)-dependent oxidoreductase [Sphingomonas sp.]|nr:NAD(P)-dependent oxidoreductase [Sphingomonas sp.]
MPMIAFLGLGLMGGAVAGRIADAGHDLVVYNRTDDRALNWLARHRAKRAMTPAQAVEEADLVFMCLSNDQAVAQITGEGGGVLAAMKPGALLIDHGSGAPAFARDLQRAAAERGIAFLDAPVTGGGRAAREGSLTVMAGGDAANLSRARPIMSSYAQEVALMGPAGTGQATKLLNVILGQAAVCALAEGLGFAMAAGIDPREAVRVLAKGSSQSWVMDNRAGAMIDGHFEPMYPVRMARKDNANVLAEARALGVALPISSAAELLFCELDRRTGGQDDITSLVKLFAAPRA